MPSTKHQALSTIAIWLTLCAVLVAMMVIIGGYTRLSGSGLSITSWKPIHGTIPPLDAQEWQEEFAAYQQSPQYKKVNMGMTLPEFKMIFWPEYIHRLLGRIIGAVFFVPLLIFAARGSLSKRFGRRLFGIFALGGLQGLIGWLMVASGLVDTPQVNPLWLAIHLATAFVVLGLLVWAVMDVLTSPSPLEGEGRGGGISSKEFLSKIPPLPNPPPQGGRGYFLWFLTLCLQLLLGALMAGTHAGLVYNTWPSMNGHFLPESWDSIALIQFLHRNIAVLVTIGFVLWWYYHREYVKNTRLGKHCAIILALIVLQFALGVATLLHQAPLPLALAHQMVGLGLFIMSVILLHRLS